jgi:hypothetical protein
VRDIVTGDLPESVPRRIGCDADLPAVSMKGSGQSQFTVR